jgi:hypothetical protein
MTVDAVSNFLEEQSFSPSLKAMPVSLCGCTPRIAVSPARNYMGPRWVAVGDAAVTRLYKDGIGSAFHTSLEAMRTALHYGIHQRAFREHYLPYCRKIAFDNICGKLLFRIWQATLRRPKVLDAWKSTIRNESHEDISQRVHIRILWGMFTGDEPYQKLLRLAISPSAIASLIRAMREQTG